MAHLIRLPRGPAEERFELKSGPNSVGRARENDLFIAHASLSRQHARIDVDEGGVFVTDLGSRNGTLVDGLAVKSSRLKHGSSVQFGEVPFVFEAERASKEKAAAAYADELRELLASQAEDGKSAIRLRGGAAHEQRSEQKLGILLTVSQLLSSPEPLEKLLEKVFDLLFQILDVDRAALLLVDEATGELVPKLTRSARGGVGSGPIYSHQIVNEAFASTGGVRSGDAMADPRFKEAGSVLASTIRSSMCAPLRSRDRNVGVLYVDHLSVPDRYGEEDLDFLAGFGTQAAVAIENARLYARLEEETVRRTSLLRFFPPTVIGPLLSSSEFGLKPFDTDVTVLFSDISGFTSMSSRLASHEVVSLLNGYFPVMAEIVFRHEGTLEKYIGDALMAIWGAPTPHPDDADRALTAALEMQEALARLNAARPSGPELAIHIGLNSGPVTFGNIGSPDYVQFAAIGDTTNVSSRVCSVAQAGETVISGATRERLTPGLFDLEELPPASVKGKDRPIEVYRVRRLLRPAP